MEMELVFFSFFNNYLSGFKQKYNIYNLKLYQGESIILFRYILKPLTELENLNLSMRKLSRS